MSGLRKTVEPVLEPVTLQEAKEHMRVFGNYEDTAILSYITAARIWCENYLGQQLVTATYEKTMDGWPVWHAKNPLRKVHLNRPPLQSVTSIQYVATDGTSTTLSSTAYVVDTKAKPGTVCPTFGTFWPTVRRQPEAVTVTYKAGYLTSGSTTDQGSVDNVPQTVKLAIKTLAAYYFLNRDENAEIPQAVTSLLDSASFGSYRTWVPEETF